MPEDFSNVKKTSENILFLKAMFVEIEILLQAGTWKYSLMLNSKGIGFQTQVRFMYCGFTMHVWKSYHIRQTTKVEKIP